MRKMTTIHINNCAVSENHKSMSRTGSHGLPNKARWQNDDKQADYKITLPASAWELAPGQPACASSLSFTVTKGNPSCLYQLLADAPLGTVWYSLERIVNPCNRPRQDPDVIINT